jgi:enediyne biosynthesis protein E4
MVTRAALLVVILFAAGCGRSNERSDGAPGSGLTSANGAAASAVGPKGATEWFTDRAEDAGLRFTHVNGASDRLFYPEILPPGVALFDFDNDGDLDVYVAQGYALDPAERARTSQAGRDVSNEHRGRLFRNDLRILPEGSRELHFTDVTEASGLETHGYGMGVATGDIDNDGFVDIYLTNFESCQLFRNNGDGTFTDITKTSGTANIPGFAVSAAFLDYDRDGLLDLYVGNNVSYDLANKTVCPNPAGAPDYCPPQIYGGRPDRLYHNVGHGKFVDVTSAALIGGKFGPALGVSTADFNGDGWIDIYVANDGEDDLLWLNQHNGTFKEVGLTSGIAVTAEGKAEASMGVDAGDFDNDGDEDVFVAELTGQGSNLYVNDGSARFRDASAMSGLGPQSLAFTGWGSAWFDYDNDGSLDVMTVNGTIIGQETHKDRPFPYDQKKLLFHNLGGGRFESVGDRAGAIFARSDSGRGAAFGDVDNDGDVDVLVGNDAGPLQLLINNIGNRNHWLGIRLAGAGGRDMLGARLEVVRPDRPTLWRRARSDGSYASANDPRVLVGLGDSTSRPTVRVLWPDGRQEEWVDVVIDRWTTLTQGTGR